MTVQKLSNQTTATSRTGKTTNASTSSSSTVDLISVTGKGILKNVGWRSAGGGSINITVVIDGVTVYSQNVGSQPTGVNTLDGVFNISPNDICYAFNIPFYTSFKLRGNAVTGGESCYGLVAYELE